ncbi:MAG TPA: carboxypeptidase regulatory-like domain-containing protein [Candidatus Polarisedimenticolaceae bacterium]|nr:carboxypeptidase regulatory-like domain-containing protein [Candidatus Polarisedimenticolaceae bacterium]
MRPALCLAVLLAAGAVSAQTGGLRIVVTDASTGTLLAGAKVVLSSATHQVATTAARTGARGVAEFPVLRAAGGYALTVQLAGYTPFELQDLRVPAGSARVVPVGLVPELQEEVSVTAHREGIDLDETRTSVTFHSEFTETLPIYGRFYQSLLTLAPGVMDADEDGNPNVLGARETDFKTQVGGVANTDPLTGGFLSYINLESVDALEIIPAGAGAEFGRAQGGFANIVQKQGTNSFEGLAGLLFGGSLLDDNGAGGGDAPEFERYQPFLQFSGAIVRDRLWYRLSHEWILRQDPVDVLSRVAVTEQTQGIHSDQLTWQVTPRNKLALQVQRDPLKLENVGVGTFVTTDSAHTIERGGTTTSLSWIAPYSARVFAEGIAALQEHGEEIYPQVPGVPSHCGLVYPWDPDFPGPEFTHLSSSQCTEVATGRVSGSYPIDSRDERRRFTLHGQVTVSPASEGTVGHQFKAGFSVENERYFRNLQRAIEGDVYRSSLLAPRVGLYFTEIHVPDTSTSEAAGSGAGVFLEDQLRFGARVTLTLGLRADREEIASESKEGLDPAGEALRFEELLARGMDAGQAVQLAFTGFDGRQDFQDGLSDALGSYLPPLSSVLEASSSWPRKRRLANVEISDTTLSPRLAVAWDPTGTGKTKLAATAGRYHDKVFLSVPLLATEPPTTFMTFRVFQAEGDWYAYGTRGGAENGRVTVVDPDLRTPYQDELTLSVERELVPETTLKLTGVKRRFRDQLQDVDLNHVPGDHGRCALPFRLSEPALLGSPGSGQTLLDPYTGLPYVDTDPGLGDGVIDDCVGLIALPGGILEPEAIRRDGLPDLYALNPAWGQVMEVGNLNTADYSAVLLELTRRYSHGWGLQSSYTWSRAVGDAEAFDQLLGDEPTLLTEERSYLSYDQRHVVKVVAAVHAPHAWEVGGTVRWESGLPYSEIVAVESYYADNPEHGFDFPLPQLRYRYVNGKRNTHRNPGYWTLDARVARQFRLGKKANLGLTFEGFNLLNDDTLRIVEISQGTLRGVRRFGRRFQVGLRASF